MPIYLRNKDLREEVIRCKEAGEISPELTQMFILLANKIANKFYYIDRRDREDNIQNALLELCSKYDKFNPEKSDNAFAYMTQVAKNGFARGWNELHPGMFAGGKLLSLDREGSNGESNKNRI
jgi:DNA-directed RNA polymerase specialized sigma subunit